VVAPSTSESVTTLRARVAGLARRNAAPERIEEAQRELAETKLTRQIRRVVDGWPPLTPAQRERLALLLHPGTGGGDG
jgi:hypothetical protein